MGVAAVSVGWSLTILATSPAMAGQFDYLDHTRLIETRLFLLGGSPTQEISSAARGLFDEMLSDSGDDRQGGFAAASVSQLSSLDNDGITLSGSVSGFGTTDAEGRGKTELDATFQAASGFEDTSSQTGYQAALLLASCPWDCDGSNDAAVNVSDLLALLAQYDPDAPANCTGGSCDFDGSGCVDILDLLKLLAHYDPSGAGCPGVP